MTDALSQRRVIVDTKTVEEQPVCCAKGRKALEHAAGVKRANVVLLCRKNKVVEGSSCDGLIDSCHFILA